MPLSILSVAFPFAPVGPEAVGGAEQVLTALDRALVAAGHRSVVVACDESQTAGDLVSFALPNRILDQECRNQAVAQVQSAIDHALSTYRIDAVHLHGMDFCKYTLPRELPVLATLHLPCGWYPAEAWRPRHPRMRFQCVSAKQRMSLPASLLANVGDAKVIENGVELPEPWRTKRGEFAIVMGRICAEKNAHAALEAAERAGVRVRIAGKVFPYPEHRRYFEEKVAPKLRAQGHSFLGPVGRAERVRLLASAKCLLHPTLAPETSSLVAMEALAVGTPVIAYRSGALTEIVEDGVTGFLVENVAEMAEAIRCVDKLRHEDCRRAAETRFSRGRMVEQYFALYEQMVCEPEAVHC